MPFETQLAIQMLLLLREVHAYMAQTISSQQLEALKMDFVR